jgi:spore maturation protein CgeB
VRLFEAAACGTPIISDYWEGLETIFALDTEILVARSFHDVLAFLHDLDERQRNAMRQRAYETVMHHHTAEHRARQLEDYYRQVRGDSQMAKVSHASV